MYLNIVLKRSKKHFISWTAKKLLRRVNTLLRNIRIDNAMMSDGHFIMDQNSRALMNGLNNADKGILGVKHKLFIPKNRLRFISRIQL